MDGCAVIVMLWVSLLGYEVVMDCFNVDGFRGLARVALGSSFGEFCEVMAFGILFVQVVDIVAGSQGGYLLLVWY